ncbi:Radical SAM superfamily protein [Thalassoglobus neptunius]|uniref:Radical SAM superfamily protein n=1 Tax=Thalassoglobus neptunius TaxID=1938619 RepID=A0A5C5WXY7_9PLAN|nr:PA0069 family radical SAM protein [Thalassoglobus neptunius]TWT55468.1 Radical SAM superfamily protein [Thalassoglobus neptunius]
MRHGSNIDPPNRFETVHHEPDLEHLEWDQEHLRTLTNRKIEYISDTSKSIVSENRSPDIPFRYSVNPYRGCVHSCSYCYARPGHDYLGFNAGLDFETKIVVKHDAPQLFREFLSKKTWKPEPITFSGVTDCYQPAEREFRLTRQCLEVALECRQPISIVTKNAVVLRDLEILKGLAADNLVHVYLSITSLDPELARDMEPRTSIPAARLRAVRMLADANVPVGVMTAPIIPGLNDSEIPTILEAAKEAGAITANYILLRLPLTVEPVFIEWLQRCRPNHAEKVLGRLQEARGGKLNSSEWGERMTGTGLMADQIRKMFRLFRQKHGLDAEMPSYKCDLFRPPDPKSGQMRLF